MWNVIYNWILVFLVPKKVSTISFADDLAVEMVQLDLEV